MTSDNANVKNRLLKDLLDVEQKLTSELQKIPSFYISNFAEQTRE